MTSAPQLDDAWAALPLGARTALEQQWTGLAANGLPCGAAITDTDGQIIAAGRNHAYDPAGGVETRRDTPLQHTRLAHAELNALAQLPTELDHAGLTLWSTQHPCAMCAAAISFVGVGAVRYLADDPSDDSAPEAIDASRGAVPYAALGDPLWWTVSNLLFLYTVAVRSGARAGNIAMNRARYPRLVGATLALAEGDALGDAARAGLALPLALAPHAAVLAQAAASIT